jgi:hypothetical protein
MHGTSFAPSRTGSSGGLRHPSLSSEELAGARLALCELLESDPCRTLAQFERALLTGFDIVVPTKWMSSTLRRYVLPVVHSVVRHVPPRPRP